jgi:hypothetical protein
MGAAIILTVIFGYATGTTFPALIPDARTTVGKEALRLSAVGHVR